MPKPDAALPDPARYPHTSRIELRYGDLDTNKHINTVAMTTVPEKTRVRFHHDSGYCKADSGAETPDGLVVASLAIEYLAEGTYPQPLDIHTAIKRIGRTSRILVQVASQGGQALAFARTVVVAMDAQGPTKLPAESVASAANWSPRP